MSSPTETLPRLAAVALLWIAAALPHFAQTAEARTESPEQLWERGERPAAVELLAASLAETPDDRALRTRLLDWELAIHRYAAALADAEPLGDDGRPYRAVALFQLGRYAEALPLFDTTRPLECRMHLDALAALGRTEELELALAASAQVLGDEDPQRLVLRGQLHQRGARYAEAASDFRAALDLDPLDLAALFGLGRCRLALGERDAALVLLERHRALVPILDRYDFALKSLDLGPLHAPNYAQLGDVERELGRTERALAAYARAGELAGPEHATPIALRHARCLTEDLGDLKAALEVLEATARRVPDARLHVRAGDLLRDAARTDEAAAAYRRALALRPTDRVVLERLASLEEGGR